MTETIPFNRPYATGREFANITDAVARGHLSGDGFYTEQCHDRLAKITGVDTVLLTTSCTHALEMSASLLEVGPGDEIIVPSFTFVSSVNAFVLRGAVPVFVDIRPDTLNLDERLLEAAITPRTKVIVVVHYGGIACEMDEINRIAAAHGVAVVEDNAHGLGATYRGRNLGTLGDLATLSFHETKNIQCGEGGALLVNRQRFAERAEIIREKGTNRSQFFRGQIDKYTWVDVGSSYLPSDLLAAFLLAQLEEFDDIQTQRMNVWNRYRGELSGWAADHAVSVPTVPAHCEHPAHMYYLLMPDLERRQAFIAHMRARCVHAVFHYVPLHRSPMGLELGGANAECPVTDNVSDCLVRLPLFAGLTDEEQARVIEAVLSFDHTP